MDRTETIAKLFGVVHAFDEDNTFFIAPNRIGFGIFASPLAGGDQSVAEKLKLIFQLDWPTGTVIQFTLSASSERRSASDSLLREAIKQRFDFLSTSTQKAMDASGMLVREMQLVISVQIPFEGRAPDESLMMRFRDLRVGFEQALEAARMGFRRLDAKTYIRFMEAILNQDTSAPWRQEPETRYDDTRLVCQQLLDGDNNISADEDGVWIGDQHRVTLLSPKKDPQRTGFGMAMRYFTDWSKGDRGIPENAVITLNCIIPEQQKSKNKIEVSKASATHFADSKTSRFISAYSEKKKGLDILSQHLNGGDAIVKCYLSLALITRGEGKDEDSRRRTHERALAATTNATAYWRDLGFHLMRDRYMSLHFFAQMMPFAGDAGLEPFLERYRTLYGAYAVAIAPVMGSWRGTGSPLMTLIARDGQLMPIDIRETDTNQNFVVIGASGGGKSFMMSHLIENYRALNGRVFIIDIGNSYKNLNTLFKGQYLTFERESKVSLNPFTHIIDYDEDAEMLAEIIQIMAAPKSGLSDYEMAGLKQVMAKTFEQYGNRMDIDALAYALSESIDPEMVRLGKQLFSFTSAGEHGSFFKGPNTFEINNPFTVLELEDLQGKPQLQRVVLMMLMNQIGRVIYQGDRSQPSLLLIDEAWSLLAGDDTAKFIGAAYRKFRKYAASVGIIAQNMGVIWDTAGGRAIVSNSATTFMVKQKSDEIDAVERENRFPFGKWGYDLARSVKTVPGRFSEILVSTDRGMGVGRLIVSEFQQIAYSTTPAEVVAVRQMEAQGKTLAEAIHAIALQRKGKRAA